MPVARLERNALAVRALKSTFNAQGNRALSFSCADADDFLMCFTKGPFVSRAELDSCLTRDDLLTLHQRSIVVKHIGDSQKIRLQMVSGRVVASAPSFTNFDVMPPEKVQVWAVKSNERGEITVYVPDDASEQAALFPADYYVDFQPTHAKRLVERLMAGLEKEMIRSGTLRVNFDSESTECADGVLEYRIGNGQPIPIPASAYGQEIPLRVDESCRVTVLPCSEFEGIFVERTRSK